MDWILEIDFDGLVETINLPFWWGNNLWSLSQSVPILQLWWKSNFKIRQLVQHLHTTNVCSTWRIPTFKFNIIFSVGSILLPLADETHMYMHGCNFFKPNLSKKTLLTADFVVPKFQSVELLLLLIMAWTFTVLWLYKWIWAIFSGFSVQKSKLSVEMCSLMSEYCAMLSSSVS